MSEDHERRISTIEANFGNLASSMSKVAEHLGKLFEQQSEMKTSIALVVQNQGDFKVYQKECDTERADHEKRITAAEGFQGRLVKYAMVLTGVGSFASPQLGKIWSRFFS